MAENESMIERVAKAMFQPGLADTSGKRRWTWEMATEGTKSYWRDLARGAIEAMCEPTEEMLAAADSAIPCFEPDENGHRLMGRDGALDVWRAMIDALRVHEFPLQRNNHG